MQGYRTKDSFVELKKSYPAGEPDLATMCRTDLVSLFEGDIQGRQLDGLVPL